ncbi:MAG: sigma-70 family RNA polymerase sigma factor [Fibrobacteraceae bacterium]|nr:sigma-70 family RNA polymerase sigma factor [Fibrobacteraceae bacterium]
MNEKAILQTISDTSPDASTRAGFRVAMELVWNLHASKVLNLAFRMLKNKEEAEDILMDVFAHLPKAAQSFRGESSISTWLFRLTVNQCLMKLRAQKRHHELETENYNLIVEQGLSKTEEVANFNKELFEKALGVLPAETRSLLWLKDAEDLEIKDLAEIYNLPEGTIKARLSRARQSLRAFLAEKGE